MNRKVIPLNGSTLQIPLLQTKLQMPHTLTGMVDRPRIHARLDESLQSRLTLVTAPAGFGKTSAVAQWTRQKGLPMAWLSLDGGDNYPVRFWMYVTAALQGLQKDIGVEISPILKSATSPPWEAALSLLIDYLSCLSYDFALVLDDYHLISESLVHETLSFLVRYAPQRLHPVIIGRTEPPIALPRLRAAGQVTELTVRDLSFDNDEAAAFYRLRNIELTGAEVDKLAARTGGWAAGMQMAAFSLQGGMDKAVMIERFRGCNHLLAGYFFEEVFNGFTPDIQEFLVQTCILVRLCGPLCDGVTDRKDGGAVLTLVARQNGFLVCLDEKDGWYVYHHLFAEFLQGLLQKRQPTMIPALHRKAARWCEANGLSTEAIDYYLQGEAYIQAAGLIERLSAVMLGRGETPTLLKWISALPSAMLDASPGLNVMQAWAAIATNRMDEVAHLLERADAIGRRGEEMHAEDGNSMALEKAMLRMLVSVRQKDIQGALHWLAQAGQATESVSALELGLTFESLEPSLLAGPWGWFGYLKEMSQVMGSAAYAKLNNLGGPGAHRGYAGVAKAEALYEWNQIDDAVKSLAEGMEEAQKAEDSCSLVPALFILAKIHLARGKLTAALDAAEEAERTVRALGRPQWLPCIAALKARLNLAGGDQDAVGRWSVHSRLDIYGRLSAARAYEHLTFARVLLARGQLEETILLLERLRVFAEKEERLPGTLETANLLAIAYNAAGRTREALEILRRNLSLGLENNYLRIFVDEGAPMLALLKRLTLAREREQRPEGELAYAGKLLALLREGPALRYQRLPAVQPSAPADALTAKEMAVLRLAAAGLNRNSIAGELGVALPTVKTHLANIYGKLGVSGRREAVEQACRLGILR
ncbi:HTH-type transcriptional regulator MalT [Peptococcaceae bacterium CEB3]|nr:HTH-type transcriptional regulator MalT [Peptococcaceae bacterium CEB3]